MSSSTPDGAATSPPPKKSDLAPRVATAVVGVPAILAMAVWAPNWAIWLFYALAAAIGCHEWVTMTLGRPGLPGWAAVVATFTVLSAGYWGTPTSLFATGSLALLGVFIACVWTGEVADAARRITGTLSGMMYSAVLFGSLLLLAAETGDARMSPGPMQAGWVLMPMMVIWAGDTGAYFSGRAFGRHKLAPKLSPKKTWEGAAGGLLASIAGGFLAQAVLLPQLSIVHVLVIAAPAAILGQIGDLSESALKRSTGVKDSGWIIYGHGGILDRVDALLFAGPWFAICRLMFEL